MTLLHRMRHAAMALLAVMFALAVAPSAPAQTFPALSGRVVDAAGVLDPHVRQALTARLAALEAKTSDQVVVATVRSLQGYSVEDYANRLFRAWRLGQGTTNNGVLLLVAPAEHKVRIEIGYGLEGTLPDAVAKLIIEDRMVSRLRANQFDGAIDSAVTAITDVLTGNAAEWKQRAASRPHVDQGNGHPPPVLNLPFILVFGVLFLGGFAGVAYVFLAAVLNGLIAIHVLPQHKDRQGWWHWLDWFDDGKPAVRRRSSSQPAWATGSSSRWSSSSSSSGSSDDSFSGGSGSSGGGGASGSW